MEDCVAISLWHNQDQVDNQGTHEIEILQGIIATAGSMRKNAVDSSSVPLAELAAKAGRRLPAKVSSKTMSVVCMFSHSSSQLVTSTYCRNSSTFTRRQ